RAAYLLRLRPILGACTLPSRHRCEKHNRRRGEREKNGFLRSLRTRIPPFSLSPVPALVPQYAALRKLPGPAAEEVQNCPRTASCELRAASCELTNSEPRPSNCEVAGSRGAARSAPARAAGRQSSLAPT